MENITKLAEEYAQSLIKVQERRKYWQLQSKPFLHKHLAEIVEKNKLNWKTGSNETIQNLESVFIVFDHQPSGIVEQSQFSVAQKIKIGGFLSFSQTRNGQVIAWISFPFIDGMTEEKAKNEILETVEPEEINDESVNRFVHKFLGEMIQWENDARDEIGFMRHK